MPGIVGRMFIRLYTWNWGLDGGMGREGCLNQDLQDFRMIRIVGDGDGRGCIFRTGLLLASNPPP